MKRLLITSSLITLSVLYIPIPQSFGSHPSSINQVIIPVDFATTISQLKTPYQIKRVVKGAAKVKKTVQKPPEHVGNIEQIVRTAAIKYGVNPDYLVRIAKCESTLNPNAVAPNVIAGTHPSGLFQHVPTYWAKRASMYGWHGASIFNAKAQAEVTAQMFKAGNGNLWECR